MEFCDEGTLESLIAGTENGLPELQVRRYTYQLLCGVACLHSHGIVHRDIKTANIFLTDEANCLKIGDFGCAAKIKSHTTMPGELKGFVGTQGKSLFEISVKNIKLHLSKSHKHSVALCYYLIISTGRPESSHNLLSYFNNS